MRTADSNTVALLQGADTLGLIEADLVVWIVKDLTTGDPVNFAFWTEHDTVTATVPNPWTGSSQSYPFVGAGAILDVGETPRTANFQNVPSKSVTMSAIHPVVRDMWVGHNVRLAQVAVYQALFDPETRNMVSALLEFVGEIDGAPEEVPEAGGEGGIRFDIVSDTRQLTRTNPAKRSDAHQRTRQNDAFHRDIGVAGDWNIPWGQEAS